MAATYGPQVVNVKVAMEHEEEGDFRATPGCRLNPEGAGTGPYCRHQLRTEPAPVGARAVMMATGAGGKASHFDACRHSRCRATPRRWSVELARGRRASTSSTASVPVRLTSWRWSTTPTSSSIRQPTAPRSMYLAMTVAGPLGDAPRRGRRCRYAYPYQEVLDGVLRGLRRRRPRGLVAQTVNGYQRRHVPMQPPTSTKAQGVAARPRISRRGPS